MSGGFSRLGAVALWFGLSVSAAVSAGAQTMTALARVDPASALRDAGAGVELVLGLSQPVPYRVYTLDAPRRLVVDLNEAAWDAVRPGDFDRSARVAEVAMGPVRPGWSRLVAVLAEPLTVTAADMATGAAGAAAGHGATIRLRLDPATPAAFAAASGAPEAARDGPPDPAGLAAPRRRQDGSRPVVVVLDPGHGGIDPGAEHGDVVEAELMLSFARELKETLLRAGGFEVMLTRDDDIFVPLEMRVSVARAAGADVFLSLHADAVTEGRAYGATVYTLSETASDAASSRLAERHDRGDLLAGVDLTRQDDQVAAVLMDMVRTETAPRADRLADALVDGLADSVGGLHKRPRHEAAFSVLKAADIPSVLVELGFLSSRRDRDKLLSPEWRAKAAAGIRDALVAWARDDAAEAALLRR